MIIVLSPVVALNKATTAVSVNDLVITIDGIDYDLSIIPKGGQAKAQADSPFIGAVSRDKVTVKYIYDANKAEQDQSPDWDDYTFEIESGEVPCPIRWRELV